MDPPPAPALSDPPSAPETGSLALRPIQQRGRICRRAEGRDLPAKNPWPRKHHGNGAAPDANQGQPGSPSCDQRGRGCGIDAARGVFALAPAFRITTMTGYLADLDSRLAQRRFRDVSAARDSSRADRGLQRGGRSGRAAEWDGGPMSPFPVLMEDH